LKGTSGLFPGAIVSSTRLFRCVSTAVSMLHGPEQLEQCNATGPGEHIKLGSNLGSSSSSSLSLFHSTLSFGSHKLKSPTLSQSSCSSPLFTPPFSWRFLLPWLHLSLRKGLQLALRCGLSAEALATLAQLSAQLLEPVNTKMIGTPSAKLLRPLCLQPLLPSLQ
jgi:hypothetical protein